MDRYSESQDVPGWLRRASAAVARFMEERDIRTYSGLRTETGLNYRTLRKLDPRHIDTTIGFEAVANIFAQLFFYMKECQGTEIGEDDDYEGLDAEWADITMEYFGKKKKKV